MKTIYAKLVNPECGYNHDIEKVKKLDTFGIYKLISAMVGQSNTSIRLEGFSDWFNSVQFEFMDEHGNEVNIIRMPEFNPYMKSKTV